MTKQFSNLATPADAGPAEALVVDFRKFFTLDTDPKKQAALRRILIEEEDRLAANREQLANAARLDRKGKQLISEGTERLERLNGDKSTSDNRQYQRNLGLMEMIQQLFENIHRRLLDVYPYSVKLHDELVAVCGTLGEARDRAQQFANANPELLVTLVDARQGRSETFYQERA